MTGETPPNTGTLHEALSESKMSSRPENICLLALLNPMGDLYSVNPISKRSLADAQSASSSGTLASATACTELHVFKMFRLHPLLAVMRSSDTFAGLIFRARELAAQEPAEHPAKRKRCFMSGLTCSDTYCATPR